MPGVSFYMNVVAVIDQVVNDIPPIMRSFFFTSIMTNIQNYLFALKQMAIRLMNSGFVVPLQRPAVYTPIRKTEEFLWLQDLEMQLQSFVSNVLHVPLYSVELE